MEAEKILRPFCKVVEVQKGSPADEAGIKLEDQIIEYGGVNYLNNNDLKKMAEVTWENVNKPVRIYLSRKCFELEFNVYPKTWDGPGILGCRFTLLENEE